MAACQIDEKLLTDYLFDELSPVDEEALEQHLTTCAACREQLNELQQVICDLRGPIAGVPPASNGLTPDRMAAILAAADEVQAFRDYGAGDIAPILRRLRERIDRALESG